MSRICNNKFIHKIGQIFLIQRILLHNIMDLQNLSPQQLQKAFKLCDIISLQDIYVATTILQTYGWDVQKAVDEIVYTKEQQHNKQQQQLLNTVVVPDNLSQQQLQHSNKAVQDVEYNNEQQDPYSIHDQQYQEMVDYGEFEYQYPENELQSKRKMFEENYYPILPLNKAVSQCLIPVNSLQRDHLLAQDYHLHRHYYQANLLKSSQQLCQRILQSHTKNTTSTTHNLYNINQSRIMNNKKFIVYLHKIYKSKINFTFGTFMLNLIRSYLDGKFLLVFILHQDADTMKNGQTVTEKLLTQPQLARFINVNCISYGMFDNSDDYEIVQKYVSLKELPAFAIFNFNKKERKEHFIASYPLLSNDNENCIEWLAKSIGVPLKKKQLQKKHQEKMIEQRVQWESISDILKEQNNQYEEIEKLYQIKRHQSKLNKEQNKEKELRVIQMRKVFEQIPQPQLAPGTTIQIKFRMPISGESKLRVFTLDQKIQLLFDYIEAMHQDQFQQPYCQFDLTQTFPPLSLKDKKEKIIKQVFEDSDRQNIIVKQI